MHNIAWKIKDVGLNYPLLHSCLENTSSFQGVGAQSGEYIYDVHLEGGGGSGKTRMFLDEGGGGMTRLDVLYCTFLCFLHNPFPSYSPVANCT